MKFQIKVDDAIRALEKNLSSHIIELKQSTEVWIQRLHEAMREYASALNRDGLRTSHNKLTILFMQPPIDHRANYNKYLTALQKAAATGQTTIEVNEDDVDHIYQDNWDWRQHSRTTNATYTK